MKKTPALNFLPALALVLGVAACGPGNRAPSAGESPAPDSIMWLLTGSYSSPAEEGIGLYEFNLSSGTARRLSGVAGISNPSFLTYRPDLNLVYSVGEESGKASTVNVLSLTGGESPSMALLQSDTTGGAAPCYVALTPNRDFVLTANYLGGNVTAYALDSLGLPTGSPQVVGFPERGAETGSQGIPHLHSINFTNDGKTLIAADLGTDRLHVFDISRRRPGTPLLNVGDSSDVAVKPATGPRHMAFSRDGRHAYLIGELSGEVCVLDIDGKRLAPVQYIASDSVGGHGSGDIHLSPDGRFLYASNRLKDDGISVFAVDSVSGKLTKTAYLPTGPHPRNFAVSPDGNWMLVACRDSNEVEIRPIDPESGVPGPTTHTIKTPKPVCLLFIDPVEMHNSRARK